jgi:hypothetical protein
MCAQGSIRNTLMSHSRFLLIRHVLKHARLNLWDKHITNCRWVVDYIEVYHYSGHPLITIAAHSIYALCYQPTTVKSQRRATAELNSFALVCAQCGVRNTLPRIRAFRDHRSPYGHTTNS